MKVKPSVVIRDLEEYLDLFKISLSEEARKTLVDVEEFAQRCDNPVNYNLFFSKAIRNARILQEILINNGINPNLAALILEQDYYATIDTLSSYEYEAVSYSKLERNNEKAAIINIALEYCVSDNRSMLEIKDIMLAAMDDYEKMLNQDGGQWVDKRLNNCNITLTHLCGRYRESLWIPFVDIREALLKSNTTNRKVKIA
ncbi:hypothetical protein [Anaerosolibacter sp.]|uniref:hypothetical protein n=1 Tax=Anaerosolibacter sp. TaxID=1872527 RepID=UPI0039EE3AFA